MIIFFIFAQEIIFLCFIKYVAWEGLAGSAAEQEKVLDVSLSQRPEFAHYGPYIALNNGRYYAEIFYSLKSRNTRHKSKLIGIDDVLAVDAAGKVMTKESAQNIVSNWLETVLPKSAKPSEANQLVLPPGTTWKDISITFLARDVVSIKCGEETAVNYERLHIPGMFVASQREKKPSDKWFLLMAFALWGPGLNRENLRTLFGHDDWNRMRTQKSALSKSLKQFFGLDGPARYKLRSQRLDQGYSPVVNDRHRLPRTGQLPNP